jgi:nitrogen PTS system EIIA component
MRMSNFIVRDSIIPALTASTKEAVIREMVTSLHTAGYFRDSDVEEITKAVLRREQLGSTGIGRHIAIPHSKHASVDHLIGTLALSPAGVPFDSIDGEPVYVFVLLVSPQDRPGDHLRALENVVRTMKDEAFVKNLRQATTRADIWRLLDDAQPPWDR